jgi:hypothetical protein
MVVPLSLLNCGLRLCAHGFPSFCWLSDIADAVVDTQRSKVPRLGRWRPIVVIAPVDVALAAISAKVVKHAGHIGCGFRFCSSLCTTNERAGPGHRVPTFFGVACPQSLAGVKSLLETKAQNPLQPWAPLGNSLECTPDGERVL